MRSRVTITDDDGVAGHDRGRPQRIVTFAPSMTEIVFALGLGDRVVGVSGPFDDYPAAAKEIEQVGGAGDFGWSEHRGASSSHEPDLFLTIAAATSGRQRLRDLGMPVVRSNATDFPICGRHPAVGR